MLGSHQDTERVPDMVEPLVGWRAWRTRVNYGRQVLVSPVQDTVWPHRQGQHLQGQCEHDDRRRGSCHCGINAFDSVDKLAASDYASQPVWGQVRLWGEVHVYPDGLRGECAAPGELFVNPRVENAKEVARGLAETYGVKVTVQAMPPQEPRWQTAFRPRPAGAGGALPGLAWHRQAGRADLAWMAALIASAMILLGVIVPLELAQSARRSTLLASGDQLSLWHLALYVLPVTLGCWKLIGLSLPRRRWAPWVWALLIACTLSPIPALTIHETLRQDAGLIGEERAARRAMTSEKVVTVKAEDRNRQGWAWEYRTWSNGECKKLEGDLVRACRRDDEMVFTPLGEDGRAVAGKGRAAEDEAGDEAGGEGRAEASQEPVCQEDVELQVRSCYAGGKVTVKRLEGGGAGGENPSAAQVSQASR